MGDLTMGRHVMKKSSWLAGSTIIDRTGEECQESLSGLILSLTLIQVFSVFQSFCLSLQLEIKTSNKKADCMYSVQLYTIMNQISIMWITRRISVLPVSAYICKLDTSKLLDPACTLPHWAINSYPAGILLTPMVSCDKQGSSHYEITNCDVSQQSGWSLVML